jgi:hypothetical protein
MQWEEICTSVQKYFSRDLLQNCNFQLSYTKHAAWRPAVQSEVTTAADGKTVDRRTERQDEYSISPINALLLL